MLFCHRSWVAAALIGFAWMPLTSTGQPMRRVDDAALRNASKSGEEWLTYGRDPGETRYSPLNLINASNVSRLGLKWSYDLGVGGGNQEATPLVRNGILYGITNWSVVFAVDVRTGKERWRWDPEVNQAAVFPKICCGVVHRGLATYQNLIIAPIIDGRLQALDADTGKVVWEARVAYPQDNYTVTMAPRIAKGKVIVGVSGSEYPVRGFFSAFDALTGHFAWKFYTVPGDPSKPFENAAMKAAAATWDPDAWKLGGGATVWDGFAYDPEADLVYVGTGNAGPWPEELRHSKGKDNLYACSVVAVRPDTGEMKWYFQMVPGDSWDYDSVQQLLLADITVKGRARKVIMQANKDGFYYVIDRVTGQFISGQPFAQVTWARGLNEETGHPIVNEAGTTALRPLRSRLDRAARTTGLPCRSIPPQAWSTFPPPQPVPTTSQWKKISFTSRAKRIAELCGLARQRELAQPRPWLRAAPRSCHHPRRLGPNHRLSEKGEFWWHGIPRRRRSAGAHLEAEGSEAARLQPLGIS